ncbi:uncharacterized protein LOC130054449 [Ostrea edulis]|uniref:uncharacterized protein LOC125670510 n=1 Tax=Ostrea edulis TaxID=37623 RepID=UPI0020941208|nr:uncharacterized protein LOC125670510 [Ostrea edulis]XP_056020320.1 uncharacterized protein LOC130054449 [Ostrea edulis]
MFRYLLVFSLVIILITEDVCAWRRIKTVLDKVDKGVRRVGRFIDSAKTILSIFNGKRSTDDDVLKLDICQFSSFDLDNDNSISDSEINVLIEMTGMVDLDEFFEQLDINKDDKVTIEEHTNSRLIKKACS